MTMSMNIEQLQDRLSEALLRLRLDQLQEVCVYAKLSVDGQSKRHLLIRLISGSVENVIETEDDDDVACQHVKDLLEFARGMTQHSDGADQDGAGDTDRSLSELARLKKQYAELHRNFEMSTSMLRNEIQHAEPHQNQERMAHVLSGKEQSTHTQVKVLRTPQVTEKKDSELYEVVQQLKEEIGEMRNVMATYRSIQPRERKRGCRGYQEQETEHRPGESGEDKKKTMQRKPSKRENQMHCDNSDDDDNDVWESLVRMPFGRESRDYSRCQQSEPLESHPEDTAMLNSAESEGEDEVSSAREEVVETDEAEKIDAEIPSQQVCKRVYPLRNRKAKKMFSYNTLGQPSIVDV
ncbi:hypothetical protein HF521_001880 [Silurus meridionalis]|uniref:Uncharacterized protein n=1 Tax=Silurus meridionalis TaxID=175797 RepID=A0A8T0B8Q6_SILME|nr:hypothetical protein HF521_001880 [Silurus meridionalis]